MTRVLDRYVYREALPAVLLSVMAFTVLHLLDRIQDFTNLLASGASVPLVLSLWAILVLSFLTHTIPMGLLVGIVVAAARLASDLEVVAFGASGVSPLRLFRPFLVVAAGAALVIANLTWWINPWGYATFARLAAAVPARAVTPMIQERVFTRIGDLVVYAEEAVATARFRGLVVAEEQDKQRLRIVTAPTGSLIADADGHRSVLRLTDGAVHESNPTAPGWYRVTRFKTYDTPVDVTGQLRMSRDGQRPERDMTAWELISNTRALEWTRSLEKAEMFITELHKRFAYPMTPIVFAMVGFGLGIRLHRGGRAAAAVTGVMLLLVYHLLQETSANSGLPRAWGAHRWAPVVVFGAFGAALLALSGTPVPASWGRTMARLLSLVPVRTKSAGRRRVPRRFSMRGAMTLADRYVARQFIAYLAAGVAVAAASFVVVDLLETLDRYLHRRPPLSSIVEHYLYRLPAAVHQALPIVVLVVSVFLFVELARRHELTAFKAAGISLQRLAVPVLVVAGLLSVASFVFQETALPVLNAWGDEVDRVKIRGEAPRRALAQKDVWYRRSDSEFFRVGRLDPARRQIADVTVVEIDTNFHVVKRIDVGNGAFGSGGWTLTPAVARQFGPDHAVRTATQTRPAIALPESPESFSAPDTAPAAMTARQLYATMEALRARGHEPGTSVMYLHAKLAFPLLHVALAMVAIACSVRWGRGGRLIGGSVAVAIAIGYWSVHSLALSLGVGGLLPPVLAAWTSTIVFGGLGVGLFLGSD